MAKEIEFKYLVKKELLPELSGGRAIVQGYLADKPAVRVRIVNESYGTLTIKGEGYIERDEFEYKIPYDDVVALMVMCSKKLSKTRYIHYHEGSLWEIDVFPNGLILAEIEVPKKNHAFIKPRWLGEDVSNNPEYKNINLAS